MIILNKDDEYVKCSCGQQFIVSPQDVLGKYIDGKCVYIGYKCPNCESPIFTITTFDGSKIIDVDKEEKGENDD